MIKKETIKKSGHIKVTFSLPADHPHGSSSVVGDFNAWDPLANPFTKRTKRTVTTSIVLPPGGKYHFRYLGDGAIWFDEPEADAHEVTAQGTKNSVLAT
ncbi:MAG: isoamylase early set domain-containing protein [Rhodothermales bacterium]|nr:isoamylase early set domain-containing protein [Rhodothermales bacterium]